VSETIPSPAREASAELFRAQQVVLLRSSKRVSTLLSLAALGGSLRSYCVGYRSSTFLRPFAPRTLLRFHATMDALTPAPAGLGGHWPLGPSGSGAGLPASRVEPSDRSVSKHPLSSPKTWSAFIFEAYRRFRLTTAVPSRDKRLLGFALSVQARHDNRPNRVRHPTDQSFASGCSPPRLATTQLPSATKSRPNLGRDFHPADSTHLQAHIGVGRAD
jgi:hypothetical protein